MLPAQFMTNVCFHYDCTGPAAHSPGPVVRRQPNVCLSDLCVGPDWPGDGKQMLQNVQESSRTPRCSVQLWMARCQAEKFLVQLQCV